MSHPDYPDVSIIPFNGKTPVIHPSAFIAPGCRIIGDVEIGEDSSVWYNCVIRGDVNRIRIGARTNIQDGTVIHCDGAGEREDGRPLDGWPTIIGDDVLVTSADRVERAGAEGVANAALIKVNQVGTVTEAKAALDAARGLGWGAIVSARSGETEDVTIAHLATGWDAGQLKVGSMTRSERMAKWNEMLRIEEAMGGDAVFAGMSAFAATVRP